MNHQLGDLRRAPEGLEGADLKDQVNTFITDVVDGAREGRHLRGLRRRAGPRQTPGTPSAGSTRPPSRSARPGEEAGGRDAIDAAPPARRSAVTSSPPPASAGRTSAPRSCATPSAASSSTCSTASGASTSTRWTTSRKASPSAPTAQRDLLIEYQREGYRHVRRDARGHQENSVNIRPSATSRRSRSRRSPISYEAGAELNRRSMRGGLHHRQRPAPPAPRDRYTAPGEDGEVEVFRSSPAEAPAHSRQRRAQRPVSVRLRKKFSAATATQTHHALIGPKLLQPRRGLSLVRPELRQVGA